jgi:hypothetical protein
MKSGMSQEDIRAAKVTVRIKVVGRPDSVVDEDEGGHCSTVVLVLVTRRRERGEAGV